MLNRYKITITKKYYFELDGKNEESVKEQAYYIMSRPSILAMPYIKKKTKIKLKKLDERGNLIEKGN